MNSLSLSSIAREFCIRHTEGESIDFLLPFDQSVHPLLRRLEFIFSVVIFAYVSVHIGTRFDGRRHEAFESSGCNLRERLNDD